MKTDNKTKTYKTKLLGLALLSTVTIATVSSLTLTPGTTNQAHALGHQETVTESSLITPTTSVTDFSNLVAQVAPSVVRVNVTQEVGSNIQHQQIPEVWKRFFEIPAPQARLKEATGSGFFISDGYLLTNHHVVDGADKITITLNDRRELDVELVGSDKRTDVALLKVSSTADYPTVSIGSSSDVRVGEPVLAIGSPFGFDYSASAGIVSATSRSFSREDTVPFIQTDVALNPGNSGGPLFNQHGKVIGVNSRIFSGTGGYMGLSFSIPIDIAIDIAQQIKETGTVTRAYMGIYPQDIDRNLAELYKLEKPTGALITEVEPQSSASNAGLRAGDVILDYNGKIISRASELVNAISRARVNDTFDITILRNKNKQNLTGTLGLAPGSNKAPVLKTKKVKKARSQTRLGISIRSLTQREKYQLNNIEGVLVGDINPIGIAGKSGLKYGDIITELNTIKTPTGEDFSYAVSKLPRKGVVEVRIIRKGMSKIIGMRM